MSSCGEVWPQFSIQGFKLTYLVEVSQKLSALSNDSWISFFSVRKCFIFVQTS